MCLSGIISARERSDGYCKLNRNSEEVVWPLALCLRLRP